MGMIQQMQRSRSLSCLLHIQTAHLEWGTRTRSLDIVVKLLQKPQSGLIVLYLVIMIGCLDVSYE